MPEHSTAQHDVIIVGAGIAGSLIAQRLGAAGRKVLILEAGDDGRSQGSTDGANFAELHQGYMSRFFGAAIKTPGSPYPAYPEDGVIDARKSVAGRATIIDLINLPSKSETSYLVQPEGNSQGDPRSIPFLSTYERSPGGTTLHWSATSLRHVPHDLKMASTYGLGQDAGAWTDWPVDYDELAALYGEAESAIGVAASVAEQAPLEAAIGLRYPKRYEYPMPPIPSTLLDQHIQDGAEGQLPRNATAPEGLRLYASDARRWPCGTQRSS